MCWSLVNFRVFISFICYAVCNGLDNMAVVLGHQVSMTCGDSANASRVQWKVQLLGESDERFIYNGYTIFPEFSEFRAVIDGIFSLSAGEAQFKHAGTYFCVRIIGHYTKTYSANLTILESDPICGSNASNVDDSVVENEYLKLWCKIRYVGGLIPRVEWQRSDREKLTSNSTYDLQELHSVCIYQMKAGDNAVNYTVTTLFETPVLAVSYENVVSASNKPEFKWIFSANVLFGPRNISITPKRKAYSAGDVLHCSSAGNPTPTFEWTEVGSAYYVDGPQLKVNETMAQKSESTYRCTGVNKVAGQRKIAADEVFIGVPGTTLDRYLRGFDTLVYVGVGAAVTGIILTAIAAAMCRLSKCRRNLINSKSEDARSSSHVYEYVSSENVHPVPVTSSQEGHSRTIASEEITDQAMAINSEYIDTFSSSEQEYNTISGRPTQPVKVYTTIKAMYENVSYPEA